VGGRATKAGALMALLASVGSSSQSAQHQPGSLEISCDSALEPQFGPILIGWQVVSRESGGAVNIGTDFGPHWVGCDVKMMS